MAKKTRRRWSSAEKAEILRRFHASGLSREAFARDEGVSATSLGKWLLKEGNGELPGPRPGIVPVHVTQADLIEGSHIEIVLRRGLRIQVREGFDQKLLEQILATLERC